VTDFTFIVNPVAAKGAAARVGERLRKVLAVRDIAHEILYTEYPGHAAKLARGSNARVIVSVGGDGTVNEVTNGIVGSGKTLGIIPAGSGNDLIKSLNIPADIEKAVETVIHGTVRPVDVGHVQCSPERSEGTPRVNGDGRYFLNGVGIGFDAAVAARTAEIPYLRGVLLYIAAVFQTLGKYQPPDFVVAYGHGERKFSGLLVAIGNGRCAGGGFYLTPRAQPDDELLDICMVKAVPLLKILRLMPKVMKGAHEGDPDVEIVQSRKVTVTGSIPFYVHADGEIVGRNVKGVSAELVDARLPVLVGSVG